MNNVTTKKVLGVHGEEVNAKRKYEREHVKGEKVTEKVKCEKVKGLRAEDVKNRRGEKVKVKGALVKCETVVNPPTLLAGMYGRVKQCL